MRRLFNLAEYNIEPFMATIPIETNFTTLWYLT